MSGDALRDVYERIMRLREAAGRTDAIPIEQMQDVLERRGSEPVHVASPGRATAYALEAADAEGNLAYRAVTRDTTVALPRQR